MLWFKYFISEKKNLYYDKTKYFRSTIEVRSNKYSRIKVMIKIGTHSMSMFSENMENSAVFINLISTIIPIHVVIWHLYNF